MKKIRNRMPMPERMKAAERIKKRNQWIDPLVAQRARAHFSPAHGIIHCDKLHKWPVRYDQDNAWAAFVDTMPRKPYKFLAMVAAAERKRAIEALVTAKRAKGRERYLRRFKQPHTPDGKP
jgi:hypothetical protein